LLSKVEKEQGIPPNEAVGINQSFAGRNEPIARIAPIGSMQKRPPGAIRSGNGIGYRFLPIEIVRPP
jgi:hypothetical protein